MRKTWITYTHWETKETRCWAKALEVITGIPAPAQTRTASPSKRSLTEIIPDWKNNPEPEGMIETF